MRRSIQQIVLLTSAVVLAVLLIACPQRTKIGELTSNPSRYAGKEVTITGTVTSTFGILGTGAFQVDDGTGTIWVLSENYGVPSKGARVGITGRVTEGVSAGGRSFAVAIRQTQKPHY